ncbi:MAG: molybdopterin-dependent oxidoreductase, partial [Deltaproteobacteria bacterium]|nr:molybdopterin-dependent oxidoreductase [Deltaproteobacteria bacterium]
MSTLGEQSRREFLKRFGGGVALFVTVGGNLSWLGEAEAKARGVPKDFNAFLRIGEDGRVTCLTGKIEMGQGPITSLPQMLADELDVAYEKVDIVMGDTDLCPWDRGTWGSLTTRAFGPLLRAAGAEARAVLLELASDSLGVPASRLAVNDGVVFDRKNKKKRISYAALAKGKPITRDVKVEATLKEVSEFRVMGKSKLRRDSREKVTGEAKYAADIRLPGMLYARILRPPAHGATLQRVDTAGARKMSGVRMVEEKDFVAVLHELPDVAEEALGRVEAKFDSGAPPLNDKNIHAHLMKAAPRGSIAADGGNLDKGRKLAKRTVETTFLDGYVAHAPMETHAALAHIVDGKCTVWASTQSPFGARDKVARAIGVSESQVRVITPFVGGGFGGKSGNAQAVEAARLAKAVGRPVQVMRTREEEFFYDTFRPAAVVKVRSGIDGDGRMTFWDYEVLFAGGRGASQFYEIPNHRTTLRSGGGAHPFATGAWRAPANNTNTFARESQIDSMAAAAGADPVKFRLKHLK